MHVKKNFKRVGDFLSADVSFSYAPGKIILTGEHAVVYGSGAIALALDRGVRVAIRQPRNKDKDGPVLNAVGLGICGGVRPDPKGEGPDVLRKALGALSDIVGPEVKALEINVDSSIPAGRGLGSSAALSVSILKGLYQFLERPISRVDLISQAMRLEKIFHGKPSGIDHTTICEGGINYFQRHNGDYTLQKIEIKNSLSFAIGMAGPHLGTSNSVKALSERIRLHEQAYASIFTGISRLALEMKEELSKNNLASVGELMNINQGYLNALGVSTPELEALCAIARERGALGAKLTGAGGGGAVIALANDNVEDIAAGFRAAGYMSFTSKCTSKK